jgi:hypothetical protein
VRESYTSSANKQQRQRCEAAPVAGNPSAALRLKKENGATEKRVIFPPGGPAHVDLGSNYGVVDETPTRVSVTRADQQSALASPNRRLSLSTQPAGRKYLAPEQEQEQVRVESSVRVCVCACLYVCVCA